MGTTDQERKKIGREGEDLAIQILRKKGYEILATNWRYRRAEVDIIARFGAILCIIEVKTRSYSYFGNPDSFVGKRKMKMLIDAGVAYAHQHGYDGELRFDIMGILLNPDESPQISHIEDAFFPEIGW